jgi:thioredoxin
MPQSITDAQFETEVLKSPLPVLVDFFAPWCGPCKIMHPVMEELEKEYEGKVKVVKVNVDEQNEVAGMFNIMSIPTFILFKEGKPVKGFMGAQPKESVKQLIDTLVP